MTNEELLNQAENFYKKSLLIEKKWMDSKKSKEAFNLAKELRIEIKLLFSNLKSNSQKDTEFKEELYNYLNEVLCKISRMSINNYYNDFIYEIIDYMSFENSYPNLYKIQLKKNI